MAHKVIAHMTAPDPAVDYAEATIQRVGDALIERVDVVFAAVDNPAARVYLADRCRLHGKPLVEAGFDGAQLTLAVFAPDPSTACYRCLAPEPAGAFSCTRYALEAEARRVVPAIQPAAAALAAMQATQGLLWLHGGAPLTGKRAFVELGTLDSRVVSLVVNPGCRGLHRDASRVVELGLDPSASVGELAAEAHVAIGHAAIRLPEAIVERIPCTRCAEMAAPWAPESAWLASPLCGGCGGPFPRAEAGRRQAGRVWLFTDDVEDLADVGLAQVGIGSRAAIEAEVTETGERVVLRTQDASAPTWRSVCQELGEAAERPRRSA